ncbi:protein YggL [Enterobacter cancerogenus]|uniref:Protein YggL n=6 Tax=Enterobacteriaceae TaxID=543 RepID=A0A484Z1P7_9ENTR|nr:protein YggL [Enterobacter cancerogenus]
MAKNRSRRLRKKMHIEEFQEVGFSVAWRFPEGTSVEQIDQDVDAFINEVIEPNKLAFDGSGYLAWEGLICTQEVGKCTEEHQALVRKWLEDHKMEDVRVSELFDVWWTNKAGTGPALAGPFCLRECLRCAKRCCCCSIGNRNHRPCGV